ncbi:MAG: actin family protein [Candidatus Hodarchaeota archaeon]
METPIILDLGSYNTKVGFAGQPIPELIFPTIVGKGTEGWVVGPEAEECSHQIYPIQQGYVTSEEGLLRILEGIYSTLEVESQYYPLLIIENTLNPKFHRETLEEMLVTQFNVNHLTFELAPVLALRATGRISGVAVDIGNEQTGIIPVFEKFIIEHATRRIEVGGRTVTLFLEELLQTDQPETVINSIKEESCYLAIDYKTELKKLDSMQPETYQMPDASLISLKRQRFEAPELFFKPLWKGIDLPPLDRIIFDTILELDVNLQEEMFKSVILCGGGSLIKGFEERLKKELEEKHKREININVIAPPNREFLAFEGASLLASSQEYIQEVFEKG